MNYLLYIDPGSGSYLLQAIIAAVLGAGFWIKMSWHRIKAFFGGTKVNKEKEEKDKPAS
ncbi:MAG: hypothetical protein KA968_09705 [Chitinophagaceae bacterium]|nr:hypothetical protein [Chitinophagaceae bacterium]MBP7108949.1 hypothetical protein [Chitinophagaceae bacterium]MBP7315482.1 hypothetical protein [Chitinophagaceae bacterium]HQZ51698.1 hypothetical protein [Chitinophagaceae bacterium]HRA12611.1 hypothetical protein [Chitinophagaceae bacterium]